MTPTLQTTLHDFINGTRTSHALVRQLRLEMRHGCGDNSCEFQKPQGMGTNGGCRCWQVLEEVIQTLHTQHADFKLRALLVSEQRLDEIAELREQLTMRELGVSE